MELPRRVEGDVRIQLGRPVEYLVSSLRDIAPCEFPYLARRLSGFIQTINTVNKGATIHLVLSMPVVLGFQIGQHVGLSHYDIQLYHFEKGGYVKVPSVKR
ncbi:MAG: SAVED domain-containing protein [Candidatus Dadabacteria bacterium]|nr:SAVED domain-containing protein [Candidatus Dadabacteria bacterium]